MMGMRSLFVLALLGTQSAVAADGQRVDTPELRQRAEDLARAASQRFTDILEEKKPVATEATAPAPQPQPPRETAGAFSPVFDWLAHSAQSYEQIVIAQLKAKDDWTTIVESSGETAKPAASSPPPELRGWSGLLEHVRDWLARANRAYRTQIVTPLSTPDAGSVPAAQPSVAASTAASPAPAATGLNYRVQEEEKIKREAEAAEKERRQTEAAARAAAEAEAARLADQEATDAKRRAEEEKRIAAAAEEKRKAQAEARARLIEEADAKRRADDEKRRALAIEVKRIAEQTEAKRIADAEAKRKADETRKQADEADAAERIAVAQAEADAKRTAEIEAEATRRMRAAAAEKKGTSAREVAPSAAASPPGMSTGPSGPGLVPPRGNGQGDAAKTESEGSSVAVPAAPERKPDEERGAAKAAATSREDAIEEAAQAEPVRQKKAKSAKSGTGKKYAYAKKAKRHHAYKSNKRSRHAAHKHRLQRGEFVVLKRGCACRCGRMFATPRKHRYAARNGVAAPGRYLVRKHRGTRLPHWHRRHYID